MPAMRRATISQPTRRRDAGDEIIETEHEQRNDQHRPAAMAVGQVLPSTGENKNCISGEQEEQQAAPSGPPPDRPSPGQVADKIVGYRDDDAASPTVSISMVMKMKASA